ncbi:AMP-binding protein [Roseivirga sp. E12]|uniref:AMP-binding protein n=1 Tax=Roseivirga sp. E12 TaxID=2819237 RepID=UPI001ABC99CB|nr:AMP-binding protein [Roseivirga sp. E12]MBO3700496.1 AMP-binding protein [Roseivirga sp. E12]
MGLGKKAHWALSAQKFIKQWLSNQPSFSISTSGSTGQPKTIEITREQMISSALATIKTLELSEGTKALVCINTDFIGGQMMLVRGMVGNWHLSLVEPSMDVSLFPLNQTYDFTALVPLQINSLLKSDQGTAFLNGIQKIIIGGAAISGSLVEKIQTLNSQCYHTYGMTETVSHIGLKPLNGPSKSDWFDLVGDSIIKKNATGCLEVFGTVTNNQWVSTNDLVEIQGKKFRWLGRADLVVNSGGIKILVESAEEMINQRLPEALKGTIALWKQVNGELGEELIGMSTSQSTIAHIQAHREDISKDLPKYHLPKTWISIPAFQFTQTGKIDRAKTLSRSIT